jgi:hypothetical protein
MLKTADLAGGGGHPAIPVRVQTVGEQEAARDEQRAALVKTASELDESPHTRELLGMMQSLQQIDDEYRVGIGNVMEPMGALETRLTELRQKLLLSRMTEPDEIMRAKVSNVTGSIDGALDRLREIHRHLTALEDALRPIESTAGDVLGWAKETGYTIPRA